MSIIPPEWGEWRESAACKDSDLDDFFPAVGVAASLSPGMRVCERCPVRADCLEFAMQDPYLDGIWGGTSKFARDKMRRQAKAVQVPIVVPPDPATRLGELLELIDLAIQEDGGSEPCECGKCDLSQTASQHGTFGGYEYHFCRCSRCKAHHSAAQFRYRLNAKRRAQESA